MMVPDRQHMVRLPHYFDLPPVLAEHTLQRLDLLGSRTRVYGSPPEEDPGGLHWMTYVQSEGWIAFTRNTQEGMPEVVDFAAQWLRLHYPWLVVRESCIQFMRTYGNVPPHIDENQRNSAINIGFHNTAAARTCYAAQSTLEEFWDGCREYQLHDSGAYLVNTRWPHAVRARHNEVRTLLTMTVPENYQGLLIRSGL